MTTDRFLNSPSSSNGRADGLRRYRSDRRTVIDISARSGNDRAQKPVLLSDDPSKCPWVNYRRRQMTRLKLLGAAVIMAASIATPALAQHMVEEPGMYAFYHPNADPGIATTRPAPDAMASEQFRNSGNMGRLRMQSRPALARRAKAIKSY
jgi:hypothetical protein